ncbi:MAG: CDP-alcohol phosphatidyltransferase family protein [Spirochaetaceae bacterium]|jgi:CDP-diacylglycerol--glycerol-3-phosphate 3-phosphatidyltransferase|nr:CDP-alcohol phosphatidyltransferase family protein [Spirochaetaceae bacterium]
MAFYGVSYILKHLPKYYESLLTKDNKHTIINQLLWRNDVENRFNKYLPNVITIFRLSLVLPFLIFIHDIIVYNCTNLFSLIIFVSIIVSDVLDGYLARKLHCTSITGAKLDIISDAFYSISSLVLFVYFKIIPVWFPIIMAIKLFEFIITSKIIKNKYTSNVHIIFDKIGKMAVNFVMLMPGLFVFRCIITNYKIAMNIAVYFVTVLFILSFFVRMIYVLKPIKRK